MARCSIYDFKKLPPEYSLFHCMQGVGGICSYWQSFTWIYSALFYNTKVTVYALFIYALYKSPDLIIINPALFLLYRNTVCFTRSDYFNPWELSILFLASVNLISFCLRNLLPGKRGLQIALALSNSLHLSRGKFNLSCRTETAICLRSSRCNLIRAQLKLILTSILILFRIRNRFRVRKRLHAHIFLLWRIVLEEDITICAFLPRPLKRYSVWSIFHRNR